jgi:hypothetical protein
MANMLFRGNPNMNMQMVQMLANNVKTNPQAAINEMIQMNPQAMRRIQSLLNAGQDPKQICIQEFQKMGIDISSILSQIN